MDAINLCVLQFDTHIDQNEISLFRGAIINYIQSSSILFHNHTDSNFRYSYPLIQYKRINSKAALVCFNSGSDNIEHLFKEKILTLRIGDKIKKMQLNSISVYKEPISISEKYFFYNIKNWIPLNEDNYIKYKSLESLIEKIDFLEKKLIGNILSMGKGLNIRFNDKIVCNIIDINNSYLTQYKGVKMMAFDIYFKSNIILPEFSGLGKGVSIGNGILYKQK